MEPSDFTFDVDLDALAASLEQPPAGPAFLLPSNRVHVHKAKAEAKSKRRGIRSLIRPANALPIVEALPLAPADRTHCLLRGDFVLCDLIPAIIAKHGRCPHLHIATLGLSTANADQLARLRACDSIGDLTVVCSHYFASVDKATTYRAVSAILSGFTRLITTRNHCKVICLPTDSGNHFVIEGSANLRSSDNLEQIVITNDAGTLAFHRQWMNDLAHV